MGERMVYCGITILSVTMIFYLSTVYGGIVTGVIIGSALIPAGLLINKFEDQNDN